MLDKTKMITQRAIECSRCGLFYRPDDARCPHCNTPRPGHVSMDTLVLNGGPARAMADRAGKSLLGPTTSVILQFGSPGIIVTLPLNKPMILGRGADSDALLDLSDLNAHQTGVSRHHCLLARQGHRLVATDLGSANGTFLNGTQMLPQESYVVADGDELTFGSLQAHVYFNNGD